MVFFTIFFKQIRISLNCHILSFLLSINSMHSRYLVKNLLIIDISITIFATPASPPLFCIPVTSHRYNHTWLWSFFGPDSLSIIFMCLSCLGEEILGLVKSDLVIYRKKFIVILQVSFFNLVLIRKCFSGSVF